MAIQVFNTQGGTQVTLQVHEPLTRSLSYVSCLATSCVSLRSDALYLSTLPPDIRPSRLKTDTISRSRHQLVQLGALLTSEIAFHLDTKAMEAAGLAFGVVATVDLCIK